MQHTNQTKMNARNENGSLWLFLMICEMFIFDYAVSRKNLRQLEISKKRFLDKLKEGLGGLRLARKYPKKIP